MKYNFPYLQDSYFLKQFDQLQLKEKFVKIIVLNFKEEPISQIQGRVIGGNINVDGSSSMRRTASLSAIVKQQDYNIISVENLLSINKKIEILIGFKNLTNKYSDFPIIWFPQGVYLIFSPNITQNENGINISLTLRDKMALLNGECGGSFPASVIFHEIEDVINGQTIIRNPTIYQIIIELVNHFGQIPLDKIIISDVDERIKQVVQWIGSYPVYFAKHEDELQGEFTTNYFQLKTQYQDDEITTYTYGDAVGYVLTDFTYPGQLIGNAGENVVTILDKIKNLLGNFEYFFDIEGNFRFQEIKNYLNTTYPTTLEKNRANLDSYLTDYVDGSSIYDFENNKIISAISVAPSYEQIKNDFIIWGKKTELTGAQIPIRYHLTIDSCPQINITHNNLYEYVDSQDNLTKYTKNPISGTSKISITSTDYRTELYLQGIESDYSGTANNYYYTELKNEWPKIYNIKQGQFLKQNLYNLDYFLDIIDTSAQIGKFSIQNIGRRTVVVNDDSINCIFEPQYPQIVFIKTVNPESSESNPIRIECENKKIDYVQIRPEIFNFLFIGNPYKSAYEEIRTELYQYTTYNEQINLSILPIYYFEPNTRITVKNDKIGINGDYMINSFSLPLDISGTMNLTCIKALERI